MADWKNRIKETRLVSASELAKNSSNFRRHPEAQTQAVRGLLNEVGIVAPLIAYESERAGGALTLIDGHLRQDTGGEWPVTILDVSDSEADIILASLDYTASMAEMDTHALAELLGRVDMEAVEDDGLAGLLEELATASGANAPGAPVDAEPQIDRAEELRQKWGVEPGDLWLLDSGKGHPHRLICGDCTDADVVGRVMDGEKADCVVTDPPYGMALDTDWSDAVGSMGSIGAKNNTRGNKYAPVIGDDKPYDPAPVFEAWGYCKEIFLWGADYYAERIPERDKGSWLVWDKRKPSQSEAIGSEFELCWSKQRHKRRILRHDWFGFLSSENPTEARNRQHPTQKPTSLIGDILEKWTDAGDIIVDAYAGSGTTIIAAENLGRRCYACEISPAYTAVALERFFQATGVDPVRIENAPAEAEAVGM